MKKIVVMILLVANLVLLSSCGNKFDKENVLENPNILEDIITNNDNKVVSINPFEVFNLNNRIIENDNKIVVTDEFISLKGESGESSFVVNENGSVTKHFQYSDIKYGHKLSNNNENVINRISVLNPKNESELKITADFLILFLLKNNDINALKNNIDNINHSLDTIMNNESCDYYEAYKKYVNNRILFDSSIKLAKNKYLVKFNTPFAEYLYFEIDNDNRAERFATITRYKEGYINASNVTTLKPADNEKPSEYVYFEAPAIDLESINVFEDPQCLEDVINNDNNNVVSINPFEVFNLENRLIECEDGKYKIIVKDEFISLKSYYIMNYCLNSDGTITKYQYTNLVNSHRISNNNETQINNISILNPKNKEELQITTDFLLFFVMLNFKPYDLEYVLGTIENHLEEIMVENDCDYYEAYKAFVYEQMFFDKAIKISNNKYLIRYNIETEEYLYLETDNDNRVTRYVTLDYKDQVVKLYKVITMKPADNYEAFTELD